MKDAEKLVAWLREAADELEKAHGILDAHGVPRELEKGMTNVSPGSASRTNSPQMNTWR